VHIIYRKTYRVCGIATTALEEQLRQQDLGLGQVERECRMLFRSRDCSGACGGVLYRWSMLQEIGILDDDGFSLTS